MERPGASDVCSSPNYQADRASSCSGSGCSDDMQHISCAGADRPRGTPPARRAAGKRQLLGEAGDAQPAAPSVRRRLCGRALRPSSLLVLLLAAISALGGAASQALLGVTTGFGAADGPDGDDSDPYEDPMAIAGASGIAILAEGLQAREGLRDAKAAARERLLQAASMPRAFAVRKKKRPPAPLLPPVTPRAPRAPRRPRPPMPPRPKKPRKPLFPRTPALPPDFPACGPPQAPALPAQQIGRYDVFGVGMIVAVHMVQIPGTNRFLFMERPSGYHPDGSRSIAGFMDMDTGNFTHIFSPDGLFCCGHTLLDSGDVVVVGGHQANAGYPDGMKSIRTFNKSCEDLALNKLVEMGWKRWYPTATLLPDGRVLVMGGTQGVGAGTANNPFWEMYDPVSQALTPYAMRPQYLDQSEQIYYPFNYVLPSGLLFTFCGRSGWILDYTNNTWRQDVPRLRGYASTQFPFTGTSLLLGLYPEKDYAFEVMLIGGQKESTVKDLSTIANRNVNRIGLTFDPATGNYTYNGWIQEPMPVGRVMPDSVLLPNGKVVILNGASTGLAGDSASGGESRANLPVMFADLYDPEAPQGQRFTRMATTRIARMYHSTACLTVDGTVVVAGCDRCFRFTVAPGYDFDPSPTNKAEYRVEIFSPPFVFFPESRPWIITAPDTIRYQETFAVQYVISSEAPEGSSITRAVIVAPCSVTHSFNTHQRLIGLEILADDPLEGRLTLRGPPHMYIALPGMYKLFLLNGDIYSKAVWVTLPRPQPGQPGYRKGVEGTRGFVSS